MTTNNPTHLSIPAMARPAGGLLFATLLLITLGMAATAARAQLAFDFHFDSNIDPRAISGFEEAARQWSAKLADPITVSLTIHFDEQTDDLANTESAMQSFNYSDFRTALTADRTSALDGTAVASLPAGDSFRLLTNRSSDNPNGAGSEITYLDENNSLNNQTVILAQANARAVGLYTAEGGGTDATISINSSYRFDFDPSDGISAGTVDFVGTATHEIGHALGFISGVSYLDYAAFLDTGAPGEDDLAYVTSLDLFRFSPESLASGKGVIDWSADARDKYFSIDGGLTPLDAFSTGTFFGDGQDASHWKDGLFSGLMDPTQSYGEQLHFTKTDLSAFDAIGYDRKSSAVPENFSVGMAMTAWLAVFACASRRRVKRPIPPMQESRDALINA